MRPGFQPRDCQLQAARAFQHHAKIGTRRLLTEMVMGAGKGDILAGLLARVAWANKRAAFLCNRDFLIDDVYQRTMLVEPAMYAGRVQGRRNEVDRHILFTSLQTVSNEERARQLGHLDWVFADEVHGLLCESGETLIRVLTEINPNIRIAGYTATAYKAKANGQTSGLGALFGPDVGGTEEPIYSYKIQDGIADGVLSPVRCRRFDPLFDRTKVDPDDTRSVAEILDTPEHNAAVIEAYIAHGGGPGIAFCVDVPHAIHMAEMARARFGLKWEAVWETSTKVEPRTGQRIGTDRDRQRKLDAARAGEIECLTNMNLLSTGFDWPACKKVWSIQPTGSAILWPQQVGRGLRVYRGETCLVGDFVGNSDIHDLGLGADMTVPEIRIRTFDPGDVVRHRYDSERIEGIVTEVADDGTRAYVRWRGPRPDWYSAGDLVLIRKRAEREVITIPPKVVGLKEREVELFHGDPTVDWHPHTVTVREKPVKTWTIRAMLAEGEATIQVRASARGHEIWFVPKGGTPRLERDGFEKVADAATWAKVRALEMDGRIDPPSEAWKHVASEPRQHSYLKRLGMRRDCTNMTKGEASAMIGALSANEAILDYLDPSRIATREMQRRRFGKRASA
jgi:superfamily II DNA or RNA helicase